MLIHRLLCILLLCACAEPISRGRRVPRGWTLDASKQDIRAVNVREQKAFGEGKTIKTDNYSSESLTTEASLSPSDGKARVRHLIEVQNKLRCKDTALETALNDAQDWHCLAKRQVVEKLEVHVSTSIGGMRSDGSWPRFKVRLGSVDEASEDEAKQELGYVPAVDGGKVIFRKKFNVEESEKTHELKMVELIKQITFELNTDDAEYVILKDSYGKKFCTSRNLINKCTRKSDTPATDYLVAINALIIDNVEIHLYFKGDERPYQVYASDTSMTQPLAYLDKAMPTYSIPHFKSNPTLAVAFLFKKL